LPFALLALAGVTGGAGVAMPAPNVAFVIWAFGGAIAQLVATALLLAAMQQRSFIVAVAYSKTEVLQVALFSSLLLREHVTWLSALAIALASIGVWLLSVAPGAARANAPRSWLSSTALLGIGSGAGFALSAVGYRAAALSLQPPQLAWVAGAYTLVWAQTMQSVLIGSYLAWRQPQALREIVRSWRVSLLAGSFGALASFGWFTAFALRNAADVRTLALVEVLYGYIVSWRVFKESISRRETIGIGLLVAGLAAITAQW
jgi:drug/metabolite transporter (DMT)-like permease